MVTALVGALDAALEPGQGAAEDRRPGEDARAPVDPVELGHALGPGRVGEPAGQGLLVTERTETAKVPAVPTTLCITAERCTQTSTSSGSRETEVKALAVMPWMRSPERAPTTVTPVAKSPSVARNSLLFGDSATTLQG